MNLPVCVPGRAIERDGLVFSPFDIGRVGRPYEADYHLDLTPSPIDYSQLRRLIVLGGFSQGMGDAVMGIGLLDYIKQTFGVVIEVWLANSMPSFVNEMYGLGIEAGILDAVLLLPACAEGLREPGTVVIDMVELFGVVFRDGPVADMYCRGLGLDPALVPCEWKQGRWVQRLCRPAMAGYVLLVAKSKVDFKSIPEHLLGGFIRSLSEISGKPIFGFGHVEHQSAYTNISAQSAKARDLICWVAEADLVVTVDTAALHLAAGFDKRFAALTATSFADTWLHYYAPASWQRADRIGWKSALLCVLKDLVER